MAKPVKYKKPRKINAVTVTLAVVFGTLGFLAYQYVPLKLKEGEAYRVTTQLLDADAKRLHYFEQLYREADDSLCATTEIMLMHMDMATVRSIPMPEPIQENVASLMRAHGTLVRPPQAGRVIGIGAGRPG